MTRDAVLETARRERQAAWKRWRANPCWKTWREFAEATKRWQEVKDG